MCVCPEANVLLLDIEIAVALAGRALQRGVLGVRPVFGVFLRGFHPM